MVQAQTTTRKVDPDEHVGIDDLRSTILSSLTLPYTLHYHGHCLDCASPGYYRDYNHSRITKGASETRHSDSHAALQGSDQPHSFAEAAAVDIDHADHAWYPTTATCSSASSAQRSPTGVLYRDCARFLKRSSHSVLSGRLQDRGRTTANIDSKHYPRNSLLGGEQSYQPLHGNSFSSAYSRPIVQDEYQAGGYHDRNGMAMNSPRTASGVYFPKSRWSISFVLVVLIQAVVALAIEAYVFGRFETLFRNGSQQDDDDSDGRTIPTYLALFIFAFLYELGLTYDALRNRNTIQIIGIVAFNYSMMLYAAIEQNQVYQAIIRLSNQGSIEQNAWSNLRPYLIAGPCVIALGSLMLSFLAYKLFSEFSWDIYKSISADLRMRHRYLLYQIYIALLKFDFFFFLGFTVQFLVIVGNVQKDAEFYVTIIAVPVTIVLLLLAAFFCRRESKIGQYFIILVYFGAMAYFTFKLYRMYDTKNPKYLEYYSARTSLTTFAVITLCLVIITIVTAFLCMRNFNKGLKPYVMKRRSGADYDAKTTAYGESYGQPLGTVPGRMVID